MPPPSPDKKPKSKPPAGAPAGPRDPAGIQQMPPPGMPPPGRGMDPMMAMLNGLPAGAPGGLPGGPPASPPPAPMGPEGMPVGGTSPFVDPNASPNMGGSALLQALAASVGGDQGMGETGDPYDAGPLGHAQLGGMGPAPPTEPGLEQLLAMLALAKSGVGGGQSPMGVPAGGSGVNFDRGQPGIMSTI
jgi:hypothetical protein